MYKRAYPVDDEAGRKARAKKKTSCLFCGVDRKLAPMLYGGVPCSVHHIIRSGRSDEACNEAFICGRCHDLVHDGNIRDPKTKELLPRLTLGIQLTLKKIRDPENWNPDRLQELFGQALPDLLPIPDFLEREYRQNKPTPFLPWAEWCDCPTLPEKLEIVFEEPPKPEPVKAPKRAAGGAEKFCPTCTRKGNRNPRRDCAACDQLNGR